MNNKPACRTKISIAVSVALGAGLMSAGFASVALAQQVERVEVTGSRLPQLSTEAVSPVTVLNSQDIRLDGLSKVEDLLNQALGVEDGRAQIIAARTQRTVRGGLAFRW